MPDPDLEMVGGGGGGDGGRTLKNVFRSKNEGGGSGHPGPLPWIRHWRGCTTKEWGEGGAHSLHPPSPRSAPRLYAQAYMTSFYC